MRVVLVAPEFPPRIGGAATYWYEIFQGLSSQNVDVHVISLTPSCIMANLSRVQRIRTVLPYSPIFLLDFLPKVRRKIASLQPDLIFTGPIEASVLPKSATPLLVSVQDTTLGSKRMYQDVPFWALNFKDIAYRFLFLGFYLQLEKRAFKKCTSMICLSKALKKEVTNCYGICDKQIDVLPIGVDLDRFNPSRSDASLRAKLGIRGAFLLYVGRLDYQKGVDDLIYSMRFIRGEIDSTLVIAGEGPRLPFLKRLTHNLNLENYVLFTGFVPKKMIPNLYASADVAVIPHRYVGFSSSVLESLASGIPVVSTATGGNLEVINEKCGLLVPPRSPNKIAEAVISILNSNLEEMKLGARGEAEKYNWKEIISSLWGIFRNLVDH